MDPHERFLSILSGPDARLNLSSSFQGTPESCEVSVSSSITNRTPLILQRLREHVKNSSEKKDLDKLQFEALSLYGRDKELEILKKSFDRLSSGVVARQLVLISGGSGTGKSSLAQSLETPTTKLNGLFVRGKFDFNNKHDPYSGIIRACVEICDHILSLQEQNLALFQKVSQLIKDGLGSELSLLVKFIPALKGVLDFQEEDASFLIVGSSSEEAKNRFRFAFQRFIRIISDTFAPLLLVLDDLQWSDVSSLDLLDICLSDPRIKKVMVVGTYRSAEVDQSHCLSDAIARFKTRCDEVEFEMTNISIENLGIQHVNKIIAVMLSVENDAVTRDLAKVCFKKTQGNPFFVLQFLQLVRNGSLIKYNSDSLSWEWNCDEIDSSTSATSNVVDLLKTKMAYLPKHLLEILKVAACLGSTFNETCLRIVLENSSTLASSSEGEYSETLVSGLKFLEQDGYIIKRYSESSGSSSKSYSWTHDAIHEAAVMLVPMNERATFYQRTGDILLAKLSASELESTIFVVANLLNAGESSMMNNENRLVIARLNHDACFRALSISAFEIVADYAGKGIKLLPDNHWNDHYDLSLDLYSAAAQAEGFLGNVDLMEQYCNIVLSQKERPLKDKMWAYHTLANSMIGKGQIVEAADLLLRILEICKCRFPKNPISIRAGLIIFGFKIKSLMKHFNPETLAKSSDPMMYQLMNLMDKLSLCLYIKKDPRLALVTLRILDWTVKQGFTDYSSSAFAITGVLMTGLLGDFHGGAWFGELSLKLMEKSQSHIAHSRTMLSLYAFVFIWNKPIGELLDPMFQSFNEGMHSGDQSSAAYSAFFWLNLRFIAGSPLESLEADNHLFSKQMKDWKLKMEMDLRKFLHQTILNLRGRQVNNPTELFGEAMSEEEYRSSCENPNVSALLRPWEGVLLAYFGDHVQHAKKTIQYGHDYLQRRYPSHPQIASDVLLKGVSCFAAARETGKVKYSKIGEILRQKIKRWRDMGNPNVIHYESFLDAESAALKERKADAITYYEMTISRADRLGFIQDAAFACERLAEFHLNAMDDKMEAGSRMGQSLAYWRDWGAMGKVRALEKKYGDLCQAPLSNPNVVIKTSGPSRSEDDDDVSF